MLSRGPKELFALMDLVQLREICREAVTRAGAVLKERRFAEREIFFKGERRDMVTDADKASEKVILDFLRQSAPGDAILAEESGALEGAKGRRWFVDPLDGTTNFAHGIPHFCVTVGVEDETGVLAGATFDPVANELFLAARGHGATVNGKKLQVSSCDALSDAVIATSHLPHVSTDRLVGLLEALASVRAVRRYGASALDLAWVAAGRLDGFWEHKIQPWDIATGVLLVQEAGGIVSGLTGESVNPLPRSIVGGSLGLQPLLLQVLRTAQGA
jgi:myo-inositol-1(or 4)-monophosphatase